MNSKYDKVVLVVVITSCTVVAGASMVLGLKAIKRLININD